MKHTTYTPRVYVGTYAKYNSGSIEGAWLDLEDYTDKDGFLEACADLHKDEQDPEFMFQDMQDIPEGLASESSIEEKLWDWIALDEQDRELVMVYVEAGGEFDIEEARDRFQGTANSGADFAENLAEEVGEVPKDFPSWICIDWEASWRCNLSYDYMTADHNGEVWFFRNC